MATFLAATMPVIGHVNPLTAVVKALTGRGHRVLWYTGRAFREKVSAVGAEWVEMTEGFDFSETTPEEAFPARKNLKGIAGLRWDFEHLFIDSAVGQRKDLEALYAREPIDAVFSEPVFFGTTLLAPANAPPAVGIGIFPLGISSRDTAPFGPGMGPSVSAFGRMRNLILNWMTHRILFGEVQRYVDDRRAESSLPPLKAFFLDAACLECDSYLQATVPEFEYPRSDLPHHVRFIGPLFPPSVRDFERPEWWSELDGERPTVLVTQGTVATEPRKLIHPTVRALANDEVNVVVTGTESLEDGPNVRAAPFLPYDELLPKVDVMVTNGGYGGVHYALKYGVPLVVAGTTEEKAEICARIAWAGVGENLRTDEPSESTLRKTVHRVLNDEAIRQRASALASKIAGTRAAETAADTLEALAGEGARASRRPAAS